MLTPTAPSPEVVDGSAGQRLPEANVRPKRARRLTPAFWSAWLPPVVLALATVAVHVLLSRHMHTPVIHADEFGYLMGARYMALGGVPTGMPYYPGYSLLLVPLWLISPHTDVVYRWALDVNGVLAGVTVLLLYALARRLAPTARRTTLAAAVVAVAAYPALVLYSNLAESENLLVPGLLGALLLFWRAVEVPTPRRWAVSGVATGLLFSIHGRALAMAAAFVLAAVWVLRPWRLHWRPLLAAGVALGATLGLSALWVHWVTRPSPGLELPPSGATAPSALSLLHTSAGLEHFGVVLAGQALYLMAAAGALLTFGVASLIVSARRLASSPRLAGLGVFALLGLLGGVVVAAVFLDTGARLDDILYGRYVEVYAVPVLLAGAVALSGRGGWRGPVRVPRQWRDSAFVLGVASLVILGTALVVISYWGSSRHGPVVPTNSFGIGDLFFGPGVARVVLPVVAGVALGGLLLVAVSWRVSAAAGVIVAVGLYLPATIHGYSTVIDQSAAAASEQVVPVTLNAVQSHFGKLGCVNWDSDIGDAWDFFNSRLFLPDVVFPVFSSSRGRPLPCGSSVVVAGRSFGSRNGYFGGRAVAWSNDSEVVWVLPGPLQDRLARDGWLLPQQFPGPLPAEAAAGSLRLGAGQSSHLTIRQSAGVTVPVVVTHTGAGAPWPNALSIGNVPEYAVRLALAWYPAGTPEASNPTVQALGAARAELASPILPGQSQTVAVGVAPLALGTSVQKPKYLAPGTYELQISLIQEATGSWAGTITPLWLNVTVTAG